MTKSVGFVLSMVIFGFAFTACSKPSAEQVIQAIKDNPSLLVEASKKDPAAFRQALQAAQDSQRKEQAKAEEAEMDKYFKQPLKPNLDAKQAYKGSPQAKITIVEYTDFECPYCSRGASSMKEVLKKYDGKVKVTVKHLPLPFHPKAMPAAQYFEAIRMQDPKAAVAFHDIVFAQQADFKKDGEDFLKAQAKKLGVKMDKLAKDVKSDVVAKKIEADMAEAREFGFKGTPSFLVGGVPVRGALPPEEFGKVIDRLLN